jgi:hypothetical protein
MEKDWVILYSSFVLIDVQMKKIFLEENGIESVIINKQDSVYRSFGEIELYVQRDHIIKAKQLIES